MTGTQPSFRTSILEAIGKKTDSRTTRRLLKQSRQEMSHLRRREKEQVKEHL